MTVATFRERGHYVAGPGGAWELIRAAPDPTLAATVKSYVGYVERAAQPMKRLQPPPASAKLIFAFGEPLSVATLDGRREEMEGSFFVRFGDRPALTEFSGECRGIEVELTPLGAWAVLGPSVADLSDPAVKLGQIIGPVAAQICEQLYSLRSWDSRFELIDRFLIERLAAGDVAPPMLEWAWQRLVASGGTARVSELAARIGLSHAHLSRSFRQHFGITPKAAASILRFNRAERLITDGVPEEVSLARLAATCGYHDQSHMTRDFRRLTGTTPAAYIGALRPDFLGHPA